MSIIWGIKAIAFVTSAYFAIALATALKDFLTYRSTSFGSAFCASSNKAFWRALKLLIAMVILEQSLLFLLAHWEIKAESPLVKTAVQNLLTSEHGSIRFTGRACSFVPIAKVYDFQLCLQKTIRNGEPGIAVIAATPGAFLSPIERHDPDRALRDGRVLFIILEADINKFSK